MFFSLPTVVISLFALANAQGGAWSQCGGIGWTGATTCVSGYTCTVSNPYYSQCLPGAATTTAVPTTVAPTTVAPTTVNPTTSVPATTTPSSTATSSAPAATGSQIRTDQDPAYHLYLQNIGGTPTLGPEASSGYFTIGSTIALNNVDGSQLFFNVNANATTAWKPVTFDKTATTTTWSLSGDTIIYGNQQNFIVCPISGSTNYNLYLSTSNDMPTGCTNYLTIHLPCLC